MINTNGIVFKVVSCIASAFVAVGATLLVSNKVYRNGFFDFKKPAVVTKVETKVETKDSKDNKDSKDSKDNKDSKDS